MNREEKQELLKAYAIAQICDERILQQLLKSTELRPFLRDLRRKVYQLSLILQPENEIIEWEVFNE